MPISPSCSVPTPGSSAAPDAVFATLACYQDPLGAHRRLGSHGRRPEGNHRLPGSRAPCWQLRRMRGVERGLRPAVQEGPVQHSQTGEVVAEVTPEEVSEWSDAGLTLVKAASTPGGAEQDRLDQPMKTVGCLPIELGKQPGA